jgi:hypothetical protein
MKNPLKPEIPEPATIAAVPEFNDHTFVNSILADLKQRGFSRTICQRGDHSRKVLAAAWAFQQRGWAVNARADATGDKLVVVVSLVPTTSESDLSRSPTEPRP